LHIAANGLKRTEEERESGDNLHLDTFAIVCVWAWHDEDGDECEGYSVWSETKRAHVQVGILLNGLMRLIERGSS